MNLPDEPCELLMFQLVGCFDSLDRAMAPGTRQRQEDRYWDLWERGIRLYGSKFGHEARRRFREREERRAA